MKSSTLLTLVCAGLMTSTAYAQGSYPTQSEKPPSANSATMAKPSIMALEPKMAAAGTEVTIKGSDFKEAKQVMFNGKEAKFTVVNDSEIRATVPTGAKSGPIEILTPEGTVRSKTRFKVGTPQ
jgi:hypothetical protein